MALRDVARSFKLYSFKPKARGEGISIILNIEKLTTEISYVIIM